MSNEGKQINKSAIRNFAIEARNTLIKSAITEAGFYGVTREGVKNPIQKGLDFEVYETLAGTEQRIYGSDIRRRSALAAAVRQKGFDEVIEETAYTWFNRLIAIRFMEVNNYLPFRMRVLSSDSGSLTPDLVTNYLDVDLNLTEAEIAQVQKAKDENAYDEAFRLLFIKACNELNDVLPGLFEKTDDYMELLLKLPYTSDGVVRSLVDTIPESNFNVNEGGQVEIIGWLYQYYNTEPKAKAFAKKGKITKEEVPAVTQLFTPDWIVRYMVENSLGRLWIEHMLANGDTRSEQEIANDFGWKYYLPEAEQEPEVQAQLLQIRAERKDFTPEDILCVDPCQGSGHILVYLFDVLMQIYREDGYNERDAAKSILERNLYGLDIDDRAYQLSYFAVLMKARQYDRMILKKHIQPHVYAIQESNAVNRDQLKYFGADLSEIEKNNAINQMTGLLDTFVDAKEYGSILHVDAYDWDLLRRFVATDVGQFELGALGLENTRKQILPLIDIGETMAQKYHVVTTNPPYMSLSSANQKLNSFINRFYSEYKADLYATFMAACMHFTKDNAYLAMITMHGWMFLSHFEKMRMNVEVKDIVCMAHLGARAFDEISGEVVQTTSFILRNSSEKNFKGIYKRLIEPASQAGKEEMFLHGDNTYAVKQKQFDMIPGAPIAYWLSSQMFSIFGNSKTLGEIAKPRQGLATSDNDRFLKLWYEVDFNRIGFNLTSIDDDLKYEYKWFPCTKGGSFRRWYGNNDYIVDWENDGKEIKDYASKLYKNHTRTIKNIPFYFKKGLSWSTIASGLFSLRYVPSGSIFETKGAMCYVDERYLKFVLALYNTKVMQQFLEVVSPTLDYHEGPVGRTPIMLQEDEEINHLVNECINLTKSDWDAYETSWDFVCHPFISIIRKDSSISDDKNNLKECYALWEAECDKHFYHLKKNEEALNERFIEIYGLKDELTPEVEDKDISVRKSNLQRDIRSLISYAVGCMFGRYSLDVDGLAYAGGDWKEAYATKYKTFMPDEDAIIPITDEEYFKDDIVARFVDFIRIIYGEETLEDNLKFIAEALGNKGDTPRAVIRNYFLNDFYKDHCNTYSVTGSGKRPIYWLFDSGKQNGFKALIYIHRYTPDTVGLIRSVYLHNAQAAIQNSLQNSEYIISTTTSATERARETRKRDKYVKQLNELRPYYQALSHTALQRIPMDLDDGVKKNYQLFQGVEISTEGKKKQTIDLLAKL